MPLTNQIKAMQEQGINDEQIVQKLQEQGYSPLDISQSLEQARIKSAVASADEYPMPTPNTEMQQSVMEMPQEQEQYPLDETEQLQQAQQPQIPQAPEYIPQQPSYPQYQQYQEYQPYQANTETMTEIAEQIAQEKMMVMKKSLGSIEELKLKAEREIEDIDGRLKKIESIIDRLQSAILNKIGSYGEGIEDVKQEMKMMQESFSKVLNPLIDRTREKQVKEEGHGAKQEAERKHKKSDGFENYLRR